MGKKCPNKVAVWCQGLAAVGAFYVAAVELLELGRFA